MYGERMSPPMSQWDNHLRILNIYSDRSGEDQGLWSIHI